MEGEWCGRADNQYRSYVLKTNKTAQGIKASKKISRISVKNKTVTRHRSNEK